MQGESHREGCLYPHTPPCKTGHMRTGYTWHREEGCLLIYITADVRSPSTSVVMLSSTCGGPPLAVRHTQHTHDPSHSEGCLYLLCICSVSALRHLRRLPVIPGSGGRRMGQRWPQRRAPHQQPPPVASRPRRLPQACLRETPYRLPRFGSYSYVILARG